jgi:hypothetical protein
MTNEVKGERAMITEELKTWVLQVMQDELAARQRDNAIARRDTSGHPVPDQLAARPHAGER